MSKSQSDLNDLIEAFKDKDFRESYAEDFLNTHIASQIRAIREQRELTQEELAELVGTKQTGISRIENVNYSARNIKTLQKIAFALDGRLHVSIETFGSLLTEGSSFSRSALLRSSFKDDLVFASSAKPQPNKENSHLQQILSGEGQRKARIYPLARPAERENQRPGAASNADSSEQIEATVLEEAINPQASQRDLARA